MDSASEINNLFANIGKTIRSQLNKGLDKAAERFVDELHRQSPSDEKTTHNKYKASWKVSRRYRNMRVIYNKKTVEGGNGDIPLVNIIESEKEYAQALLEEMQSELAEIILSQIE